MAESPGAKEIFLQALLNGVEKWRKANDIYLFIQVGKDSRGYNPVFKNIAEAGRE